MELPVTLEQWFAVALMTAFIGLILWLRFWGHTHGWPGFFFLGVNPEFRWTERRFAIFSAIGWGLMAVIFSGLVAAIVVSVFPA